MLTFVANGKELKKRDIPQHAKNILIRFLNLDVNAKYIINYNKYNDSTFSLTISIDENSIDKSKLIKYYKDIERYNKCFRESISYLVKYTLSNTCYDDDIYAIYRIIFSLGKLARLRYINELGFSLLHGLLSEYSNKELLNISDIYYELVEDKLRINHDILDAINKYIDAYKDELKLTKRKNPIIKNGFNYLNTLLIHLREHHINFDMLNIY